MLLEVGVAAGLVVLVAAASVVPVAADREDSGADLTASPPPEGVVVAEGGRQMGMEDPLMAGKHFHYRF